MNAVKGKCELVCGKSVWSGNDRENAKSYGRNEMNEGAVG